MAEAQEFAPWDVVRQRLDDAGMSNDQVEEARRQYFEKVVAPGIPESHLGHVWKEFDDDTSFSHGLRSVEGAANDAGQYVADEIEAMPERRKAIADTATGLVNKARDAVSGVADTLGHKAFDVAPNLASQAGIKPTGGQIDELLASAEDRHRIPAGLLDRMATAESNKNPDAVSHAGAQGLMQFMPATAKRFGIDPHNPAQAADGAGRYMRILLDRYDGNQELAVAAYNAGEGAVDDFLNGTNKTGKNPKLEKTGGIPPWKETQDYVSKILGSEYQRQPAELRGMPVTAKAIDWVKAQYEASTPQERAAMVGREDWIGRVARTLAGPMNRAESANPRFADQAERVDSAQSASPQDRQDLYSLQGQQPTQARANAMEDAMWARPDRPAVNSDQITGQAMSAAPRSPFEREMDRGNFADTLDNINRQNQAQKDSIPGFRELAGPEATPGNIAKGILASVPNQFAQMKLAAQLAVHDVAGDNSPDSIASRNNLLRQMEQLQADNENQTPNLKTATGQGLYGGGVSMAQNAVGLFASIMTGNPAPALAMMGLQTGLPAYGKYRTRGGKPGESALGGLAEGSLEVGTELMPMGFLVSNMGKAGMGKFLSGLLGREMAGEQVATITQDAVDTAIANPDKTWAQFWEERPNAAYQTALGVLVQAGTMGAIHKGMTTLAGQQQPAPTFDNQGASSQYPQPVGLVNGAMSGDVKPDTSINVTGAKFHPDPIQAIGNATSVDEAIQAASAAVGETIHLPEAITHADDASASPSPVVATDPAAIGGSQTGDRAPQLPVGRGGGTGGGGLPAGLGGGTEAGLDDNGESGRALETVDEAAHQAATSPHNDLSEPTDDQKKAGNYAKGHTTIGGMDISIENPQGSTRSGVDESGKAWSQTMADHYGYFRGSLGRDKDHVDVFIKPGTPKDYQGPVYVVDQVGKFEKFDEHKALLGYSSPKEAWDAYHRNYEQGWKGAAYLSTFDSVDAFKAWVYDQDATNKRIGPTGQKKQQYQLYEDSNASAASQPATAQTPDNPVAGNQPEPANGVPAAPAPATATAGAPDAQATDGGQGAAVGTGQEKPTGSTSKSRWDSLSNDEAAEFVSEAGYARGDAFDKAGNKKPWLGLPRGLPKALAKLFETYPQEKPNDSGNDVVRPAEASAVEPAKQEAAQEDQVPVAGVAADNAQGKAVAEKIKLMTQERDAYQNRINAAHAAAEASSSQAVKDAQTKFQDGEIELDAFEDVINNATDKTRIGGAVDAADNQQDKIKTETKTPKPTQEAPGGGGVGVVDTTEEPAPQSLETSEKPPFVKVSKAGEGAYAVTFDGEALREGGKAPGAETIKNAGEDYGKANKLFTEDAAAKARARLRSKLGQLNTGIDPEMMLDGMTLAGYHIEAGARAFADYAKAMVDDLGEAARPYLRSWYESVRHYPGFDSAGMTDEKGIEAYLKGQSPETEVKGKPSIDLSATLSTDFVEGVSFGSITEARKRIAELTGEKIEPGTESAKQADEAIELAAVLAGREIVQNETDQGRIYDRLVTLYGQMPNLNVRTSTSVEQQAYSTPLPLAYLASRLAGVAEANSVLEPTAGNGALLIEAKPAEATVNELNPARADALRRQGFEVSENDAANPKAFNGTYQAIVTNPPFGPVKEDGVSKVFQINPRYSTTEVDHVIALNALDHLTDDGKAVLIVGGPAKTLSDEARSNAYNGKAKRAFFYTLYNQYNVINHFTVSGELYAKQGAAWPVDVIVIDGRGKSARKLPAAQLPTIINSWEELKNELPTGKPGQGTRQDLQENGVASQEGRKPEGDNAAAGTGNVQQGNGERPANGESDGILPQPEGVTPTTRPPRDTLADDPPGSLPVSGGTGARPDSRGGRKLGETPKNSFQSPYTPASGSKSVGTLVPSNMKDSVQEALDKLAETHGDVDAYVAKELGYKKADIPNYFSAEQVDALALALDNIGKGKGFIIGDQTGVGKGRVVAGVIRYAIRSGKTPIFVTEKPNLYGDMLRDLSDIGMPNVTPVVTNSGFDIPMDEDASRWYEEAEQAKAEGDRPPARYGEFLKTPGGSKHSANLNQMAESGKLDGDVIFTTYNQMQTVKGERTDRMDFLERFADGGVVIFDESHNAGGNVASSRSKGTEGGEKTGRAAFSRQIARLASSVFYSSATYAKRPEVMDLYFKTDMGMAMDSPGALASALNSGGIPLQQVVASMLAKAGQYIRREKSFDGIDYMTVPANVDRKFAENTATIMRDIMTFDRLKQDAVNALDNDIKSNAIQMSHDKSTGGAGASSTNFTSVMHNLIAQMLLTLKVQPAIQEALAALGRNEKPVIALANTMGSAIQEYVEDTGLKPGDAINLTFGDLLKRYLQKSRRVIEGDPFGKKTSRELTDAELGPTAVRHYKAVMKKIDGMNFGDVPISPIDAIKQALAEKGYRVGEITGRQATIDYSFTGEDTQESIPSSFKTSTNGNVAPQYVEYARGKLEQKFSDTEYKKGKVFTLASKDGDEVTIVGNVKTTGKKGEEGFVVPILNRTDDTVYIVPTAFLIPTNKTVAVGHDYQKELDGYRMFSKGKGMPVYRRRGADQTSTAGKRKTINDFNSGKLDAIVLNQSGATGLSIHASEKFPDRRKRFMIIAQPELNIDTHMQMLGRVNRTGQVVLPAYAQLVADIPAEKRPASILSKKMAMLNANTTGAREGAMKAKDTPDFMNQYGDEVAALVMGDNPKWHTALGRPLREAENGDGYAKEDAMRKVTGRIPVLPLTEQEKLYQAIEDAYLDHLDTMKRMGQNTLEAEVQDLDAKPGASVEVQPRVNASDSPFAEGVNATVYNVKRLGKPYTFEQIKDLVAKNVGAAEGDNLSAKITAHMQAIKQKLAEDFSRYEQKISENEAATEKDAKKQSAEVVRLQGQLARVNTLLENRPGNVVTLISPQGIEFPGYVGKVERKGDAENPVALGMWKITVYVADPAKQFTIPLSQIGGGEGQWQINPGTSENVADLLKEGQSASRENRTILTGNLLSGFGAFNKGQIVNFKTHEGRIEQGILMPRGFDLEKANKARPVFFKSPEQAASFLRSVNGNRMVSSENGDVRISSPNGNYYTLMVPGSKAKGARYFLNRTLMDAVGGEFVKTGQTMNARFDKSKLNDVLSVLDNMGDKMQAASHKEEATAFMKDAKLSLGTYQEQPNHPQGTETAQSLTQSWADKLGIEAPAITVDSTLKAQASYQDGIIRLSDAVASYLSSGNAMVRGYGTEILAHEFGHHIADTVLGNADAKTRNAVEKDYNRWLKNQQGRSIGESLASRMTTARGRLEGTASDEDLAKAGITPDYALSVHEWLADNTARVLLGQKTNGVRHPAVHNLIQRIAELFRKLWQAMTGSYDTDMVAPSMERFLQGLIDRHSGNYPGLPEGSMAYSQASGRPRNLSAGFTTSNATPYPIWYSELQRAFTTAKQQAMPGKQWLAWINANKAKLGVKDEEIQWSGLPEWLALQTGKVDKGEVVRFLGENGVRVEEVQKSNNLAFKKAEEELDAYVKFLRGKYKGIKWLEQGTKEERKEHGRLTRVFNEAKNEARKKSTKFDEWQLKPGGENYRELLLTLPKFEETKAAKLNRINNEFDKIIDEHGVPINELPKEARKRIDELTKEHDAIADAETRFDYYNTDHFDEPNILAHVRFNERTDDEGRPVLFLEEVQSDWGQDARRGKTDAKTPYADTKAWTALALKRVIRYAAENGFAAVAWTNGEQQAERYDLSKQVSAVEYKDNLVGGVGKVNLEGPPSDGVLTVYGKDGQRILEQKMKPDEVEDHIGKEAAQKLFEAKPGAVASGGTGGRERRLSGLDLKVGGEGMKGYYDRILPQTANEVLKKLGGGRVEMLGIKGLGDQMGFDISRALRDRALGGLPLFSKGNTGQFSPDNPDIRYSLGQPLEKIQYQIANQLANWREPTVRTFNKMDKSIHTQLWKAEKSPEFRRAFDASLAFEMDVARFANESADEATLILPKLTPWDVMKGAGTLGIAPGKRAYRKAQDMKAVAPAIFKTTLDKVPYTAQELDAYTPDQQALYRQFFSAVNHSLDELAKSEMYRSARALKLTPAPEDYSVTHTANFYYNQVTAPVKAKIADVTKLWAEKQAEIKALRNAARSLPGIAPAIREEAKERAKLAIQAKNEAIKPLLAELRSFKEERKSFINKAAHIEKMKREGYAPLSRFGEYTVEAIDMTPGDFSHGPKNERIFYSHFDTEGQAKQVAKDVREEYPNAKITRGIANQQGWQMFRGLTPETMKAFANNLHMEQEEAFQQYLKMAVNNRSALKRLIKRKGMAGYSEDLPRVLAAFLTSNARQAAKNYHLGEMIDAIQAIPKQKGDVIDEAVNLYNYVQNPQEAGAFIRNALFTWYLGGSVASAAVNMTQTLTMTLPYLSSYGAGKASAAITKAMRLAWLDKSLPKDLRAALHRADEEGVTAPHELHMLHAASIRTGFTKVFKWMRPLGVAWGSFFSAAESYNRRVAFIAAFQLAKDAGEPDPFTKAVEAVNQTQGIYNKSNRPNAARGTIGQAVFTFKMFSIIYTEMLMKLPAKERSIALTVLILLAGVDGLPFAEDIQDMIDTIGQSLGYNIHSKGWMHEAVGQWLGRTGRDLALYGITSQTPFDLSQRLGVANLIPGTSLLKKSEKREDRPRDLLEFAGPTGSFVQKGIEAFDAQSGRGTVGGKARAFAEAVSPIAMANAAKGAEMIFTGKYTDMKGRKVESATKLEGAGKFFGFQPANVAARRRVEGFANKGREMAKAVRDDILELWARGIIENDLDKQQEARAMRDDWNKKNPEWHIEVDKQARSNRVESMRQSSAERIKKSTPKAWRERVMELENEK